MIRKIIHSPQALIGLAMMLIVFLVMVFAPFLAPNDPMFESVNETATEYTFVKNPNYWGEEPDVDRFTVKVIPESKVAAMRSGEVDFIIGSDTLDANS